LDLNTTSLVGQVGTMGQPLFQYQAPTGYPEESQKWVSSGALISRLNFSLALTEGKLGEIAIPDLSKSTGDTNQLIDRMAGQILHGGITATTRETLMKQSQPLSSAKIAALLLGSPEFQRH